MRTVGACRPTCALVLDAELAEYLCGLYTFTNKERDTHVSQGPRFFAEQAT